MKLVALAISFVFAGVTATMISSNESQSSSAGKANSAEGKSGPEPGSPKRKDKVIKTEAEWKKILTPSQFQILRQKGTEQAFCGLFHDAKDVGTYSCAGCNLDLFTSDTKFDSGTGWPSFFQPVEKDSIWVQKDYKYGMIREEVLCARCDGHLGHVFNDGPRPTGLRFCINSDALKFRKKGQAAGKAKALASDGG